MTNLELATIRALDKCRFGHRPFDLRFVRDLRWKAMHESGNTLTRHQQFTLASIAYRYRRQLVRFLSAERVPTAPPKPADFGIVDAPQTVADLFTGEKTEPHAEYLDLPDFNPQRKLL